MCTRSAIFNHLCSAPLSPLYLFSQWVSVLIRKAKNILQSGKLWICSLLSHELGQLNIISSVDGVTKHPSASLPGDYEWRLQRVTNASCSQSWFFKLTCSKCVKSAILLDQGCRQFIYQDWYYARYVEKKQIEDFCLYSCISLASKARIRRLKSHTYELVPCQCIMNSA